MCWGRLLVTSGVIVLLAGCGPAVAGSSGGDLGSGGAGLEQKPELGGPVQGALGQFVCDLQYPAEGLWRAERGYGKATAVTDAIAMAQRVAREALLTWASSNLNELERLDLEASIDVTWVQPTSRCEAGVCEACAVAFARRIGPTVDEAVRSLKTELQAKVTKFLAAAAAQKVKGKAAHSDGLRVLVSTPVWPDGRTAGRAGSHMSTQVWGSLGDNMPAGSNVALVDPGAREWDVELAGKLTQEGTGCALVLSYGKRGANSWMPLGSVPFHPKAIGLKECSPPKQTWASDEKMGLQSGRREGADGLQVWLEAPTEKGMFCEGRKFAWHVRTSAPAYVRVYSVMDDGRIQLGWESDKPVTNWEPEERNMAIPIRMGENLEYRLVAVAVPAASGAAGFGKSVPWEKRCIAAKGTGLSTEKLPDAAAVAALTFGVTPAGQHGCETSAEIQALLQKYHRILDGLPTCDM